MSSARLNNTLKAVFCEGDTEEAAEEQDSDAKKKKAKECQIEFKCRAVSMSYLLPLAPCEKFLMINKFYLRLFIFVNHRLVLISLANRGFIT